MLAPAVRRLWGGGGGGGGERGGERGGAGFDGEGSGEDGSEAMATTAGDNYGGTASRTPSEKYSFRRVFGYRSVLKIIPSVSE